MKILVLNCGSSSVKYQFIDTKDKIALAKGLVERIGMSDAILSHTVIGKKKVKFVVFNYRRDGFKYPEPA